LAYRLSYEAAKAPGSVACYVVRPLKLHSNHNFITFDALFVLLASTEYTVNLQNIQENFQETASWMRRSFILKTNRKMSKISYYTQEGLDQLNAELNALKSTGRSEMARQIAEARDKGDLSENAEYDAAKEAQGLLELKIAKLEEVISNARVLDENNVDTSKVSILSKVKIKNHKNGAMVSYTLVSEEEADLKSGKISVKSPIGKGLLGKKVGEIAEIEVPAGKMKFEVQDISLS
jgi:transcription elongation factor GreA